MTRQRRPSSPRPGGRRAVAAVCVVLLCAVAALVLVRDRVATAGGSAPPASTTSAATDLDPELRRRFEVAQDAASAEDVTLTLTSGWRSAADQQALVDDAVERYGSLAEARRWVLPPESSAHVAGLAIDVGPTEGALWLGEHGAGLGLCRTYANEMWHFEMLADGAEQCPEPHPDSSGGW